jgi:hypothetical protein
MGFTAVGGEDLANAIRSLAVTSPVTKKMETEHGTKYIIDGMIHSPSGGSAQVRTVWIVDLGDDVPRFVTASPREREP